MSLTAFLSENVQAAEEVEFVVSSRFKGEDGKPVAWKLKPVTASEDQDIRKDCYRISPINGKRKNVRPEFDGTTWMVRLTVACVVYPNLNDAALQDSWGVKSAESLVRKMLLPGELADLQNEIQKICGFETMQEMVDEAKN